MSHILIQFHANLAGPEALQAQDLEQAALRTLAQAGITGPVMLALVISTNEHLQDLNLKFRGIDAPTDILSFASDPLPAEIEAEMEGTEDETEDYLGDVIISLPYVAQRVAAENRPLRDEICLLVVHGVLHLLGYDHSTPTEQAEMWALQAQTLQSLGITLEVPAYLHEDN
jgi:probable rRNA maturation factor